MKEATGDPSVWRLDDKLVDKDKLLQPKGVVILNASLALIKHLMSCRDKDYIQNAICSRFSVEALKEACEVIYTYSEPNESYGYRGPNKVVNVRDRSIHAFDGIYLKLTELDAKGESPHIACPSDQMAMILSLHNDPVAVDDRFRSLERDVSKIMKMVEGHSMSFPPLAPPSAIQPATRERLNSESSLKRKPNDDGDVASEESESEAAGDGFTVQSYHAKKRARKTYSDQVKAPVKPSQQAVDRKKSQKSKAVWGKSSSVTTEHLSGPPPQVFLVNCRPEIEEENVKKHFQSFGISLVDVKLRSHHNARKKSFVLTVGKRKDFDQILSGDLLPEDIGVRQYWNRQYKPQVTSNEAEEGSLGFGTMRSVPPVNNVPADSSGESPANQENGSTR